MTTKCFSNAESNANDTATDQPMAQAVAPTPDSRRSWLWWFLAIVAASQLYFVRELVAAFALFAIAFVAIAFVVASLYMLAKAGELALTRLAELRQPVMAVTAVQSGQRKAA